jgi:hypothetical protein
VPLRPAHAALLAFVLVLPSAAPSVAQPLDPFAVDVRTYEFSANYLLEAWNKNLSTEQLGVLTFTAGASWAPGWQGVTEFALGRAMLRGGPDATYVGLTGGVRRRIAARGPSTFYLDGLVGIAVANRHVPGNGTSFNWIAQGGGGVLWRLGDRVHGVTGIRVFHLSNGGLQGDHRNPDIEAIGGYAGLGWTF